MRPAQGGAGARTPSRQPRRRTHRRRRRPHGVRYRRSACPPSPRSREKRPARELAFHERRVCAPAPLPRAGRHARHRRPAPALRPPRARAPLCGRAERAHTGLPPHRAAQRVLAPLPRRARRRRALGRRLRHRGGTHHRRARSARHPHGARRAPTGDAHAHRCRAAAGHRRDGVSLPRRRGPRRRGAGRAARTLLRGRPRTLVPPDGRRGRGRRRRGGPPRGRAG